MPYGDGTGPIGQNSGGRRNIGTGRGRAGGSFSDAGPGGYCVCPKCGMKISHQQGTPCNSRSCPQCGTRMSRG